MKKEIAQLKAYILYMLMLPEWPPRDFGHFVDHFGSFAGTDWETGDYGWYRKNTNLDHAGSFGVDKLTFDTMAKSLFGTDDFQPGIRVWWYPRGKRDNLSDAELQQLEGNHTHVYPLPAWLANLVMPGNVTEERGFLAHPAFLEGLSVGQMLKMLKFALWVEHEVGVGTNVTPSDVLRRELKLFEDNGFTLREEFQVRRSRGNTNVYEMSDHGTYITSAQRGEGVGLAKS